MSFPVVPGYDIHAVAGSGGMGTVYRARDVATGDLVAVKLLRDTSAISALRFAREIDALARITDDSIVRYRAHGQLADGGRYLVTEWLDGHDLQARLGSAPIDVRSSAVLVRRVAFALACAHREGLVHRDVKPSNVFLVGGALDRAKLLDFGIARAIPTGFGFPSATQTGTAVGTPGYMAPEQARGARDVDARADVFSLGCIWFECLVGMAAFRGENVMAILAKILLEEAPRVRDVAPETPAGLAALIDGMLSKDRDARPRDGDAMLAAIDALGELPDIVLTSTRLSTPAVGGGGLSTSERRMLAIVAIRDGVSTTLADAEFAPTIDAALGEPTHDAIGRAIAPFGAHAVRLVDGTRLAILTSAAGALDLAVSAARCALAIRAAADDVAVSVALGRATLGAATPVGGVIDRAAELLSIADRTRELVLDSSVVSLLDARFEVAPGREGSTVRLVGERDVADVARLVAGRPAPFVGREREMGALHGLWDEVLGEPRARAVVVVAGAGVGKSRLRAEFVQSLSRAPTPPIVWFARCEPVASSSPLSVLSGWIRDAARIARGTPREAARSALEAYVSTRVGAAARSRVAAVLADVAGWSAGEVLDTSGALLAASRRDPHAMGDQIRHAFVEWLDGVTQASPLLLVAEDLHAADGASLAVIDAALAALPDRPWMLLATARPEIDTVFPELWSHRDPYVQRLPTLSKRSAEKLVRAVGGDSVEAAELARIVDAAGGNPFFLEELLRAQRDTARVGGRQSDDPASVVPDTLLASVESRVQSLDAHTRRVARAASVFGIEFWRGGVQALVGRETLSDVSAALAELVRREIAVPQEVSRYPGESEFRFRHAILRDATYAMLTDEDRSLGHTLAATWLQSSGETDAVVLAEHFERGGQTLDATREWLRAGQTALVANDFAGAARDATRAIEICRRGDVTHEPTELVEALRVRAEAEMYRDRNDDAERDGLEVMALSRPGSRAWWLGLRCVAISRARTSRRQALDELAHVAKGAPTASDAGFEALVALCTLTNGLRIERLDAAADMLEVDVTRRAADFQSDPAARAFVGSTYGLREDIAGRPLRAQEIFAQVANDFAASGHIRSVASALNNLASAQWKLGNYEASETSYRRALELAERIGNIPIARHIDQNLARTLIRLHRSAEARLHVERALEWMSKTGNRRVEAACRVYLAEIHRDAGERDAAVLEVERALACAPNDAVRASVLAYHAAMLLARRGDGDVARALASGAEAHAMVARGVRPDEYERLVELSYAEALEASGRRSEARRVAKRAADALRAAALEIGDDATRRAFMARVDEHARLLALENSWAAEASDD